jgi:hypothetical protein
VTVRTFVVGLVLVLLASFSCRKDPGPRKVMEMNITVVRDGDVEEVADYLDGALRKFLAEPYGRTDAEQRHLDYIRAQREFYRTTYNWHEIAAWLAGHFRQESDLAIAVVYEFDSLAGLEKFLDGRPEEIGVPIVPEVMERFEGCELKPASHNSVRFVTARAPVFFSSAVFPLQEARRAAGKDCTVLELMEEGGAVDRWGVGYYTARNTVYSTLCFRARGVWLMWPLVSG